MRPRVVSCECVCCLHVSVRPRVVMQVVMDFHAHLNMNEVIGLLAGECDEDRRLIRQVTCSQDLSPNPGVRRYPYWVLPVIGI